MQAGYLFPRQSSSSTRTTCTTCSTSTVVVPVVDREADGSGTMVTGRSITISWSLQP